MKTTAVDSPFIIMNFPRFAGGKFISNCLSLSRHCCPQDLTTALHLLDHPDDYQYRLQQILSTLPPTKPEMKNWISRYEFGDIQIYGNAIFDWWSGKVTPPSQSVSSLIDNNLRLFLTAHGGDQAVRNLYKVWPDSPVITLTNHRKFSTLSQQLKSDPDHPLDFYAGNYCESKYTQLAGISWPLWHHFESLGYDPRKLTNTDQHIVDEMLEFYNWKDINGPMFVINVDDTYFDQHEFLLMIQSLYEWLGFDDFTPELVTEYWSAYMNLHRL